MVDEGWMNNPVLAVSPKEEELKAKISDEAKLARAALVEYRKHEANVKSLLCELEQWTGKRWKMRI